MGSSASSEKITRPAKLPDSSVNCGRRRDYLKRLGIQQVKKCKAFCDVEAKGFKHGQCKSKTFDCKPPVQHAPQIVAVRSITSMSTSTSLGPSDPSLKSTSLKSTTSKDIAESGEEDGDTQLSLLDLKRQDDFRLSFLRKLSYKKVWVSPVHRSPKHQTVIIFDWDDTLLCTHHLSIYEGRTLPRSVEAHLRIIEQTSKRLLEQSLQLGHTFIITNAEEGWVEHSAALFAPGLLPVLKKIRIISARSNYQGANPTNVSQWKICAFKELQKELDVPVVTNLTAIGDSKYEMDAARIMGDEFEQALCKTIKFRQNPSAEDLAKQLELVVEKFESVVQNGRSLKICLERTARSN